MKIAIAGAGSVGRYLVERLVSEDHEITVIDQNESVLDSLSTTYDIRTHLGSASLLGSLTQAGVKDADIFIAATDSDETNLIACLLADSLSQNVRKVARVRKVVADASGLSERIAGVFDQFINPDIETVAVLEKLFDVPNAVDVMEFCGGRVWVAGVVPTPGSPVVGKHLKDLSLPIGGNDRVLVAAIARGGKVIIPKGEDLVQEGDEIYIVAPAAHMHAAVDLFHTEPFTPIRFVMIYGGGGVGRRLALALAQKNIKVKLIEPDEGRCEELASALDDVLVLNGDGTDHELLVEEGVAEADFFVGITPDEEKNVLASLLAKRLGARASAVVVAKSGYQKLVEEIGVDVVVSPHAAVAARILRFLRKGAVSSVFSTRDDGAEVLEVTIPKGSSITGVPLSKVSLPKGVLVAVVLKRDMVLIPRGETVIEPGDNVVFFAIRGALQKLQKLLEH